VGGAGITWLKNTLGALEKPEDSEEIARSVPDAAGERCSFWLPQILASPGLIGIPHTSHVVCPASGSLKRHDTAVTRLLPNMSLPPPPLTPSHPTLLATDRVNSLFPPQFTGGGTAEKDLWDGVAAMQGDC